MGGSMIRFTVYGKPEPAGSKTAGTTRSGARFVRDANPAAKEWKRVETAHKYVGVKSCQDCHDKKTRSKSMAQWSRGPHARAFETLGAEKARAIAAKQGIEDPQTAKECLKCHTAGWGHEEKWYGKQFTLSEGVSCEACHGPADDWLPMTIHARDRAKAMARGMVIPTEALCLNCHNQESPTHPKDGFDYKKARKKIIHWKPKEEDKE